jgi:hypothetical protein
MTIRFKPLMIVYDDKKGKWALAINYSSLLFYFAWVWPFPWNVIWYKKDGKNKRFVLQKIKPTPNIEGGDK